MQNIKIEMIEKLFQYTSSDEIKDKSFKLLIPEKKEIKKYLCAIVISVISSYLFSVSENTVELFFDTVDNINNIVIALFGIVFTGYALFQAFIGKEMLLRMLSYTEGKGDKEKSNLQKSNESFAETMMLQFICIVLNVFLIIIGKCIPENWTLFENAKANEYLAMIGIGLYFYLMMIAILEIKGFIYNIFQFFNLHAGSRIIEILKENNQSEHEK